MHARADGNERRPRVKRDRGGGASDKKETNKATPRKRGRQSQNDVRPAIATGKRLRVFFGGAKRRQRDEVTAPGPQASARGCDRHVEEAGEITFHLPSSILFFLPRAKKKRDVAKGGVCIAKYSYLGGCAGLYSRALHFL